MPQRICGAPMCRERVQLPATYCAKHSAYQISSTINMLGLMTSIRSMTTSITVVNGGRLVR